MSKKPESKTANIPDVSELRFDGWEDVQELIQEMRILQLEIGTEPDDKKGKPGTGKLARIHEIKAALSTYAAVNQLEGLRVGRLVFSDCWIDGRKTVDIQAVKLELVQRGVDLGMINKVIEACTKEGDGYMRRMLTEVDDAKIK